MSNTMKIDNTEKVCFLPSLQFFVYVVYIFQRSANINKPIYKHGWKSKAPFASATWTGGGETCCCHKSSMRLSSQEAHKRLSSQEVELNEKAFQVCLSCSVWTFHSVLAALAQEVQTLARMVQGWIKSIFGVEKPSRLDFLKSWSGPKISTNPGL